MSEDNVNPWNGVTKLDLDPARVVQAAADAGLSGVVIIGTDADGGDVLWHMERAKFKLMVIAENEVNAGMCPRCQRASVEKSVDALLLFRHIGDLNNGDTRCPSLQSRTGRRVYSFPAADLGPSFIPNCRRVPLPNVRPHSTASPHGGRGIGGLRVADRITSTSRRRPVPPTSGKVTPRLRPSVS